MLVALLSVAFQGRVAGIVSVPVRMLDPKVTVGQERRVPVGCPTELHHAHASPALLAPPSSRRWGCGKADGESPSESPLSTAQDPPLCGDQHLGDGLLLRDGRMGNCS